jgi:hypothetical protein
VPDAAIPGTDVVRPPGPAGRTGRTLAVAGLVVAGLVVAGLGAGGLAVSGLVARGADASDPPSTGVTAVAGLLSARDRLLAGGRRAPAVAGTGDVLLERLRDLPVASWTSSVRSVVASSPTSVDVRVRVTYRLAGDTRDVERYRRVTARRAGGGWHLVDDVPDGPARDLWDLGPVRVVSADRAVVVAAADVDRALVEDAARTAQVAAARVDAAWGRDWRRRNVVLVPSGVADAARLVGRPATGGLEQMAAFTVGAVGTTPGARGSGDERVVLVPDAFAALTPAGRRVVLVHELTHVATRARARLAPPLWLQEGFADHVAYAGTGLATSDVIGDGLDAVAAGALPDRLPDETSFDPAGGDLAAGYAQAWLACEVLAGDGGTPRLVAAYRVAAGIDPPPGAGTPADDAAAALRGAFAVARTDEATFLRAWRRAVAAAAQHPR